MRGLRRTLRIVAASVFIILSSLIVLVSSGCAVTDNLSDMFSPQMDLIGNEQDNMTEFALPVINDDLVYLEITDLDESDDELYLDLKLISKPVGEISYKVSVTSLNEQELQTDAGIWTGSIQHADMQSIRMAWRKNALSKYSISEINAFSVSVEGFRGELQVLNETANVALSK